MESIVQTSGWNVGGSKQYIWDTYHPWWEILWNPIRQAEKKGRYVS